MQQEIDRLQKKFDFEVQERVDLELQKRSSTQSAASAKDLSSLSSTLGNDIPLSSVGTSGDCDNTIATDLTEMSMESPDFRKINKKTARTPFGRAQTMFAGTAGTPMDVEMSEPSPMCISSLSLSPRRTNSTKTLGPGRNIFAAAARAEDRLQPTLMISDDEDDDEEVLLVPSPTRPKSSKNPFKPMNGRPTLISQKTAPLPRPNIQPNIFKTAATAPSLPTLSGAPDLRSQPSGTALKEQSNSPNRRLSKIPSSTNLQGHENNALSPTRKSSLKHKNANAGDDLNKLAVKNNMAKINNVGAGGLGPRGRTLVELAQARAGGRPVEISDGTRSPEPKGQIGRAHV